MCRIIPYFENTLVTLGELSSIDIQTYYSKCLEGYKIGKREYSPVKAATVKRRHSNIRKALQYAYEMELIQKNPADFVALPKIEKFEGDTYKKWYYVKKKCQLNRNFFYLTSTFEKC